MDEIERVETAIRRTFRELNPSWTSIARAAILAMDRRAPPSALPDAWQVKVRGRWCNLPEDWSHKDCSPDVEYRPLYASPPAPAVAVPEAVLAGKIQNLLAVHLNIEDGEMAGTGPASYAIARHLAAAPEPPAAEAPAPVTDDYDRGRRDVLNAILALNPQAAEKLAKWHDDWVPNPEGKLPFDVVVWVHEVAAQLGIEPKEQPE